jgi:hypothetical protein
MRALWSAHTDLVALLPKTDQLFKAANAEIVTFEAGFAGDVGAIGIAVWLQSYAGFFAAVDMRL